MLQKEKETERNLYVFFASLIRIRGCHCTFQMLRCSDTRISFDVLLVKLINFLYTGWKNIKNMKMFILHKHTDQVIPRDMYLFPLVNVNVAQLECNCIARLARAS